MEENLYLDLCTQFGMKYRDHKPQEDKDGEDEDGEDEDEENEDEEEPSTEHHQNEYYHENGEPYTEEEYTVRWNAFTLHHSRRDEHEPLEEEYVEKHNYDRAHSNWVWRSTHDPYGDTGVCDPAPNYLKYTTDRRFASAYGKWHIREGRRPRGTSVEECRWVDALVAHKLKYRQEATRYFRGQRH